MQGTREALLIPGAHPRSEPRSSRRAHALAFTLMMALGAALAPWPGFADSWLAPQHWRQLEDDGFGSAANAIVYAACIWRERVYVGTFNRAAGAQIWSYDDRGWDRVDHGAFRPGPGGVYALVPWGPRLVACVSGAPTGVYLYDGARWIRAPDDGRFAPGNTLDTGSCVLGTRLVVSTYAPGRGTQVVAYDGQTWQQLNQDGFGSSMNYRCVSMAVDGAGRLHAGVSHETAGARLMAYHEGRWRQINEDGFGDPRVLHLDVLAAIRDDLVAGMGGTSGPAHLWRRRDGRWEKFAPDGMAQAELTSISDAATLGDTFYVGGGGPAGGAQVWCREGSEWARLGATELSLPGNSSAYRLLSWRGRLVVAVNNSLTGVQVWEYSPPRRWPWSR